MTLPHAVVFDCDGTIADTESLSATAWRGALVARGLPPERFEFSAIVGRPFQRNWEHHAAMIDLGDREDFRADIRTRFRVLFDQHVDLFEDVLGVMHALVGLGIPVGVCSSSTRGHVDRVLARAGVDRVVATIVAAEDVDVHKPDPEPYLLACDRLGVTPAAAAAVEDTTIGLRSARAAGMRTIAVLRHHSAPDLAAHAHLTVGRLTLEALHLDTAPGPRAGGGGTGAAAGSGRVAD